MFKHQKKLLFKVKVDKPNPAYAALIQEQIGGPAGELRSGLQYFVQSFRIKDSEIRDLFMDIAAEEFSHLEIVMELVNQLNGDKVDIKKAELGSVEAHVYSGLTPMLANASGYPFTAAYLDDTGDLAADLLSNIAGEQRAKAVYQNIYRQIDDKGVRETIDFLLNREEAHNFMFREAFNKIQKDGSQKDFGVSEDSRIYFDLSDGEGQNFTTKGIKATSFKQ